MDLTKGLLFDIGSTDLVQSRSHASYGSPDGRIIHAGVIESNWPIFMKDVYRILKPGTGWAQCLEFGYPYCLSENNTLPKDSPLSKVDFVVNYFNDSVF